MSIPDRRDETKAAVALRGITKLFPGTIANADINLEVMPGEVLALLGENGAGKSTLMKILYGIYQPDQGDIFVNGRKERIRSPQDAHRLGIGMIHQHFSLVPVHSVLENIMLSCGCSDARKMRQQLKNLGERYGLEADPDAIVERLPVGMQQRVEILKALCQNARILIMDEPTAVLTPQETEKLFVFVREFKSQGHAIIFISHKMDEVQALADTVTVLRGGRVAGSLPTAGADEATLIRLMMGYELHQVRNTSVAAGGQVLLAAERLGVDNDKGARFLHDLSFAVRAGEILGIAGVSGNGQDELAEALVGLRPIREGRLFLGDAIMNGRNARDFIDAGVGYIPADRQREGLVLDMSVEENLMLKASDRPPFCRGGRLDVKAVAGVAREAVASYSIRTPDTSTRAKNLSGGNQQKIVVAREMNGGIRFLLACQPTRGLDLGSIDYVHRALLRQRDSGAAIVLISTELSEIFALSDRISVMFRGALSDPMPRSEASLERVGSLMTGSGGEPRVMPADRPEATA